MKLETTSLKELNPRELNPRELNSRELNLEELDLKAMDLKAMDLKKLTDDQFHQGSIRAGKELKVVTLRNLKFLNENERRRHYSKYECDSLHAFAMQYMGMDDPTAGRLISAARLLREIPEVEARVLNGTTQVTSLAYAGVFFRKEARLGKKFDLEEKKRVMLAIDTKTTCDAARVLISNSSNPEIHFREKVTPKTETITEVTSHYDRETMEMVERLREVWSHAMPQAKISDLVKRAVAAAIEKHDPLKKAERSEARACKATFSPMSTAKPDERNQDVPSTPAQESAKEDPSQQSHAQVKHKIWLRDEGKCTFVDPRTGECCESRHFVEEDHIIPKAMGGEYTLENIRLRCRAHNQRHAINTYGFEKIRPFLN